MIWNFELPLLLRGKIFPKIKLFCWYDSEIWTASIITSSNVHKNTPDLMKLPEYLNCPCYHEVVLFEKIRQFSCWFALPLLTRAEVFAKSKAVLTKSLEHSNYPCYHEVKISQKYGRFYEVNWKFALPVLCRDNIFPKRNGVRGRDIKTALNLIELYLMIMAQFKYSKNKAVLLMWLENVHLSLLSRAEIFAKNKTVLMTSLENSIYLCYHEVIWPRK